MKPCPQCGADKQVRQQESHPPMYICDRRNMQFDGIDDGVVGYGRQDRYAERKEEYEIRQKQRNHGRHGRHDNRR